MRIKEIYRRFKYLINAYIIILLIWVVVIYDKRDLQPVIDNWFVAGFYSSYIASLFEDILFFGLIGFMTLALSTKLPEDEDFVVRVKSLANNKDVGDNAKEFLLNKIRGLLAYNSNSTVNIVIKEYNSNLNLIKIYNEIEITIVNMCKDVKYSTYKTVFFIKPYHSVNNNYGYISYLGIMDKKNADNKSIFIEGDIVEITTQSNFRQPIEFQISEDSSAKLKMCFTTWCKINGDKTIENDWYFNQVEKYTENYSLIITNKTGSTIKFDSVFYENIKKERKDFSTAQVLNENQPITICSKKTLLPFDKFDLYFYS